MCMHVHTHTTQTYILLRSGSRKILRGLEFPASGNPQDASGTPESQFRRAFQGHTDHPPYILLCHTGQVISLAFGEGVGTIRFYRCGK